MKDNQLKVNKSFVIITLILGLLLVSTLTPSLLAAQRSSLPANRIVFSWNRDGDFDLYLLDGDTLKVFSQLTDNRASDLSPVWSPDGTRIAFTSDVGGNYEIYVLDISTGESSVLTSNNWDDLYPAWSPDGKKIAFTSNRDSNWDIYVMDSTASGKSADPTRLTTDATYQGSPVWSPDGKRIAYVEGRDTNRDIMVMNADGSKVQPLTTRTTSADFSPVWSPAGDQIAFVSNRSGNPDIFVVDVGCIGNSDLCDQQAVNLTQDNSGGDADPSWLPDGEHIVFASGRNNGSDLYVMKADGSDVLRLTNGDGEERFPSWWAKS